MSPDPNPKRNVIPMVDINQAYFDSLPVWEPELNDVGAVSPKSIPTTPHRYLMGDAATGKASHWLMVGHPDMQAAVLNIVTKEPDIKTETIADLIKEHTGAQDTPTEPKSEFNRYQRRTTDQRAARAARKQRTGMRKAAGKSKKVRHRRK